MQAWTAVRIVGEAATRTNSTDPAKMVEFIKGPSFEVAAFKGQKLTLRDWDLQLRQPILLADGRMVVSVSPQDGFLHQTSTLDTLGYDRPETRVQAIDDRSDRSRAGGNGMRKRLTVLPLLRDCARASGAGLRLQDLRLQRGRQHHHGDRFRERWRSSRRVPVGQRPRGITITHRRQVRAALRHRRRHGADHRRGDLRDRRHAALRTRSGALRAAPVGQAPLHRQRGRQPRHRGRRREALAGHRDSGRRRAGRHGHLAGRQGHGEHVGNDEHGAFHRHRDQPDHPQRAGRYASALRRVQERTARRCGCRPRSAARSASSTPRRTRSSTRSPSRSPGCGPRRSSRSACASPRTARPPSWRSGRPTASRWSTPRPTRWRTTCSSASASGSSASRRTRA